MVDFNQSSGQGDSTSCDTTSISPESQQVEMHKRGCAARDFEDDEDGNGVVEREVRSRVTAPACSASELAPCPPVRIKVCDSAEALETTKHNDELSTRNLKVENDGRTACESIDGAGGVVENNDGDDEEEEEDYSEFEPDEDDKDGEEESGEYCDDFEVSKDSAVSVIQFNSNTWTSSIWRGSSFVLGEGKWINTLTEI